MIRISTNREFNAAVRDAQVKAAFKAQLKDLSFVAPLFDDVMWESARAWGDRLAPTGRLLVIGFGGSSLGAKAIVEALATENARHIVFLDNLDIARLKWFVSTWVESDQVLVVSKSGETVECQVLVNHLTPLLKTQGVRFADHITVVTSVPASSLGQWAQHLSIPIYPIPPDLSGRFSVLSYAGLLPVAFAGVDLVALRAGALTAIRSHQVEQQIHGFLASFDREEWLVHVMIYSDRLLQFGAWLQQLWCESLPKAQGLDGGVPERVSSLFFGRGVSDHHSVQQQIIEGAKDRFMWILEPDRIELADGSRLAVDHDMVGPEWLKGVSADQLMKFEAAAFIQSLNEANVSYVRWQLPVLSAALMGHLIVTSELIIWGLASCLGVDPFNQPGVERTKLLTRELIARER